MQTLVTSCAVAAWARSQAMTTGSRITGTKPTPPGTQIMSSGGQSAKVLVGTIARPQSLITGARLCQT